MAGRIRTIKPEVLSDAKAARLSDSAWRLWVSSWTLADDEGRLPADPVWLSGQVFWANQRDCDPFINELERAGLVTRYRVNGDPFIQINGWKRHQKINRPSGARYPAPQNDIAGGLTEGSLNPHGGLTEGSLPPTTTIDHRPSTPTTTTAGAIARAWPNAGLTGVPGAGQFAAHAEFIDALPADQKPRGDIGVAVCSAFVRFRAAYLEHKNVDIKAAPDKLLQHLTSCLEIAIGKLDIDRLGKPRGAAHKTNFREIKRDPNERTGDVTDDL